MPAAGLVFLWCFDGLSADVSIAPRYTVDRPRYFGLRLIPTECASYRAAGRSLLPFSNDLPLVNLSVNSRRLTLISEEARRGSRADSTQCIPGSLFRGR